MKAFYDGQEISISLQYYLIKSYVLFIWHNLKLIIDGKRLKLFYFPICSILFEDIGELLINVSHILSHVIFASLHKNSMIFWLFLVFHKYLCIISLSCKQDFPAQRRKKQICVLIFSHWFCSASIVVYIKKKRLDKGEYKQPLLLT